MDLQLIFMVTLCVVSAATNNQRHNLSYILGKENMEQQFLNTRSHPAKNINGVGNNGIDQDNVFKPHQDLKNSVQDFASAFAARFSTPEKMAEFIHGIAMDKRSGLSGTCVLQILDTVEALIDGEPWAWQMLDSWGKPGTGILVVHPVFRGDYKECQRVVASRKKSRPTQATYSSDNTSDLLIDVSHPTSNRLNSTLIKELRHSRSNKYVHEMDILKYEAQSNSKHSLAKRAVNSETKSSEWASYLTSMFGGQESKNPAKFGGKFCRVGLGSNAFPIGVIKVPILGIFVGISLDVCLPDSCDANDATILMNKTVESIIFHSNVGQFVTEKSSCLEDLPWESKTIGVIVFIVVSLCWLAFCSLYDIYYIQKPKWKLQKLKEDFVARRANLLKSTDPRDTNGHILNGSVVINGEDRARLLERDARRREGEEEAAATANGHGESLEEILFEEPTISSLAQTLQFFSVYTNGNKILKTEVHPETLKCVHGMRFISMCWIILGHTMLIGLVNVENVAEFMFENRKHVLFLILANGFLCVDTFFLLSGIMVGYVFQQIADNTSKLKYPVYVLHRFFRLSPSLVVFAAIYLGLWPHLGAGPNYPAKAPDEDMCRDNWMYTLFFINNFLNLEQLCMMWTWYLSCDYQFYLICPIFMIPLAIGWKKTGVFIAVAMAIGTMVTSGVISYTNKMAEVLPQFFIADGEIADPRVYYNYFYQTPYCRMGPYIVGLLLGYVLNATQRKVHIPKPLVVLGWIASTVIALTVIFGIHASFAQIRLMSTVESAVYNAFKHTAFGLSVAWVLFACVTGHGGFVNSFLSWKAFIPVSRLTYCTYLVHPAIIYLFSYSVDGPVWLNSWNLVIHWIGVLVISLIAGFFLTLTVESPTIRLEKDILRRMGYE